MPDETDHARVPDAEGGPENALASRIAGRKRDHLQIHLDHAVDAGGPVWASFVLRHDALPETDLEAVDLSASLFGTDLGAPLVISGMTGGCDEAHHVNDHLAAAAAEHRIAMGVGSQRAAIELPDLRPSYEVIKEHDVPLVLANLGAPQLVEWGAATSLEKAEEAIAMVEADVLALHLNFLQECVQPEGDTRGKGVTETLAALVDGIDVPVLVKETGAGIGGDVARRLIEAGVSGIDVGGLGGTSFSAVETYRAAHEADSLHERIGRTFWDWGVPTPTGVEEVRYVIEDEGRDQPGRKVELVATGGIKTGLDGAKALALGADAFGMAGAMLRAADRSAQAAQDEVAAVLAELRTACFLTGSPRPEDLRRDGIWLRRP